MKTHLRLTAIAPFCGRLLLSLGCLTASQFGGTMAAATEYSERVMSDGPIHYWRFEEESPEDLAVDEILGVEGQANNPGTYSGSVTLGNQSAGIGLGNAVKFDGMNGTYVALGTAQHAGNSLSVEAWINLSVEAAARYIPIIALATIALAFLAVSSNRRRGRRFCANGIGGHLDVHRP